LWAYTFKPIREVLLLLQLLLLFSQDGVDCYDSDMSCCGVEVAEHANRMYANAHAEPAAHTAVTSVAPAIYHKHTMSIKAARFTLTVS